MNPSVYQRSSRVARTGSTPSARIRATTPFTLALSSSVRPAAVESRTTLAVRSGCARA